MRVLLTHELFPPDFAGGGEYLVLRTAQQLTQRGLTVRVLTTGNPRITEYEGVSTFRLPIHRYRFNLAVRKIAQLAREADLIQTFNYHACLPSLLAGKLTRKPVVCMALGLFHDAWKEMRLPLAGALWSAWEQFQITRGFTRVIFLSPHSYELGLSLGVARERSVMIFPGIDLENYGPASEKENVVFFTGKLDVRKGIFDFLEVARALPEVRFRVMGWGRQETHIRSIAPPNVEFLGFKRGESLHRALGAARIFFFPTRAEPFGLALAEAMASGCAIISTSPLEFEGIRVPIGDRHAMAQAVRHLWASHTDTDRMGRRNIELAQQYNWNRYTSALLDVYSSVLKRNPTPQARHR